MVSETPEDYKSEFAQWLQKPRADLTNAHITKTYKDLFLRYEISEVQEDYLKKLQMTCAIMLFTQRIPRPWFYKHVQTLFSIWKKCDDIALDINELLYDDFTLTERLWLNRCRDILPSVARRLKTIIVSIR